MNKIVKRISRFLSAGPSEAPAAKPVKAPVSEIGYDLLTRLQEIARHGYGNIAIYGDAEFYGRATETIRGTWFSDVWEDAAQGARLASEMHLADYDCILLGGANVAGKYVHALNLMKRQSVTRPALWVGERFEFTGGNVCVPGEAVEAEIIVFNHFDHFFGVREPLLATIKVSGGATRRSFFQLFEPGQSIRYKMSELLPERQGPAVFQIYTSHPRLSGGRHYRWRVFADIHFRDSFTSLHGTHYFEPPGLTTSRFDGHLLPKGKIIVSHCRYENPQGAAGADSAQPSQALKRNPDLKIEDLILHTEENDGSGFLHYSLEDAHKGLFCFLTEPLPQADGGVHESVMANHLIQMPVAEAREGALLDDAMREKLRALNAANFMMTPYPIPVLPADAGLEYGIAVGNTNPLTLSYRFHAFDRRGAWLGEADHTYQTTGAYYTSDILALFPSSIAEAAHLVVAAPHWEGMGLNPKRVKGQPDLLIRNKRSGDRDLTEFQSCWRNLGIKVADFPHWIMPQKAVTGGSRLWGRMRAGDGYRTAFTVVFGSGNRQLSGHATFRFRLLDPAGREQVYYGEVPAFGASWLWLDECFDASRLPDGWGVVIIESADADLNVQAVTVKDDTVALQHLWGY